MESSLFSVSPIATPFVLLPIEDRTPTLTKTTNQFSVSAEEAAQPNNIEHLIGLYKKLISTDNLYVGFGGLQHFLKRSSICDSNGTRNNFHNNNLYINPDNSIHPENLGVAANSCMRIQPISDRDAKGKIIGTISASVVRPEEGRGRARDFNVDLEGRWNPTVSSTVIDLFQVGMDSSCPTSHFDSLPDELILLIFSYLDVKELSNIAVICKKWNYLSSTDSLWRPLLNADVKQWEVITHLSYPNLYQETDSEWTQKDIYRQCCPELRKWKIEPTFNFWKLTFFWNFFQKRLPKIGIFGPGLESRTKKIMQRILCDPNEGFKTTGIIPGSFSGIGSFFTMSVHDKAFNLTVMYSGTKKDRENSANQGIHRLSRLEQMQQLKELCRTLDGFVFVVDASDPGSMSWAEKELLNVTNERWSATHTPVLVLSCVPGIVNGQCPLPTLSCIDIVKSLKLSSLTKPWQVRQCLVHELSGAYEGMKWVLGLCEL